MNRREAIKRTAFLMGGTISAAAMTGVLSGCQPTPQGINWEPQFLTLDQDGTVSAVVGRIIPTTDTPGAVEVGVPEFIDLMLKDNYKESDQKLFLDGLIQLEADAMSEYNKSFAQLSAENQDALLKKYDEAAYATMNKDGYDSKTERPFFNMIKELTLLGFFTSEVGATEVLQYDPLPGTYEGCVPLAEVGKAWAT